ncbi:hypothetical protein T439DRAFT_324268 [Meredithblackwellia eburnea MCA 4105]
MAGTTPADLPWATKVTYDPKKTPLPAFKDLPIKHGLPCAWDVWGAGDQLGTVNLLTPELVAQRAKEELKTGHFVSLNLPVQIPQKPSYHRLAPAVKLIALPGEYAPLPVRDDELHINSQSGTQWDGLRHFGCLAGMCFYQGIPTDGIKPGVIEMKNQDPRTINPDDLNLGVHHWSNHGIAGRGVLIDMVSYYTRDGSKLPYDPCSTHAIPLEDIKACAAYQKTEFKHGDILIFRFGWTRRYLYESNEAEKSDWGKGGDEHFAGIENSPAVQEWLWDNHFAAVASDQPAFESWPPKEGQVHLHSTIIGMYGSPIGEFFDTERLSEVCKQQGRYSFFFSSQPLNILGGAASLANASAIF